MAADRVVLITGASSGIGEAIARGAAAAGHRVVLAARSAERVEALAAELGGPGRALAVPCDVTEWDQVRALADAAVRAFGGIDVVVANAGFGAKRGFQAESPEHWRSMVLTNVYGAAITVRATLRSAEGAAGPPVPDGVGGRPQGAARARSTAPPSGRSPRWRRRRGRSCTARASASRSSPPGRSRRPFYDEPVGGEQLTAEDVARAVLFAMDQPPHVDVNEILIRPTVQEF